MGYGKVGVSKDDMCSYKLSHNSAMHNELEIAMILMQGCWM